MIGAAIQINGLTKSFGDILAVRGFELMIEGGEFISILGASGSGKTTVLRMLAGLEEPSSGSIFIDGQNATDLPPEKREIGLVFQDYALFPHMTVSENVAFPLHMRRRTGADVGRKVDAMMKLVGVGELGKRRPAQLSGGQQQRVALARALVFEPKLLLLDEPLSALDKNLREYMKAEIKALHRRMGVTVIYVTHDQSEALALSDRVVVMRNGRILDIDRPDRLYALPSSAYLATFIGDANLLKSQVEAIDADVTLSTPIGRLRVPRTQLRTKRSLEIGMPTYLVVRPENITVAPQGAREGMLVIRCRIEELLYNGANTTYTLAVEFR